MTDLISVTLQGGKYTIRQVDAGKWECLRYGEPWPAFDGKQPDNLHTALAFAVDELTDKVDEQSARLALIRKIAEVSTAVGFQAGEPALEQAGQIISVLAAHPEHIDRFMNEGSGLFLDGTFAPENGSLTYRSIGGSILHPEILRRDHDSYLTKAQSIRNLAERLLATIFKSRKLPDFWRAGQRVRVIKSKHGFFYIGDVLTVVDVETPDTPADQEQVLWLSYVPEGERYKASPEHIELIEDVQVA